MAPIKGITGFGGGAASPFVRGSGGGGGGSGLINSVTFYSASSVSSTRLPRGFNVYIYHASTINRNGGTGAINILSGESPTLVYSDYSTTSLNIINAGDKTFNFGGGDNTSATKYTEWQWNGVNDIVVDTCTSNQNNGDYASEGTMRYFTASGNANDPKPVYRYSRTDSVGNSCTDSLATGTDSYSYSIKMGLVTGGEYRIGWTSALTTANATPSPFNIYYRRNRSQMLYHASRIEAGFVP